MVNSYHQTATETDEADDWFEGAIIGPEVHHTHFGLCWSIRCFDDGLEGNALLDEVKVAICGGNRSEVGIRGSEPDAFACEGVKRLQQELIAVFGQRRASGGEPIGQEDSLWNRGMVEERK